MSFIFPPYVVPVHSGRPRSILVMYITSEIVSTVVGSVSGGFLFLVLEALLT